MEDKKVIKFKNFPSRLPLTQTIVVYLFLDKLNAAQWILGAIGILYLLIWISAIIGIVNEKHIDIFEK